MVKILAQLIRWKIGNLKNYFNISVAGSRRMPALFISSGPSKKLLMLLMLCLEPDLGYNKRLCSLITGHSAPMFLLHVRGDGNSSILDINITDQVLSDIIYQFSIPLRKEESGRVVSAFSLVMYRIYFTSKCEM